MKKIISVCMTISIILAMTSCNKSDETPINSTIEVITQSKIESFPYPSENPSVTDDVVLEDVLQNEVSSTIKPEIIQTSSNLVISSKSLPQPNEIKNESKDKNGDEPIPKGDSNTQSSQQTSTAKPAVTTNKPVSTSEEMRAIWISYLDLTPMIKGKTETQFKSSIKKSFSNISKMGLNTVIVQVRPFSDALYVSKIFPMSHIVTGTEGKNPGFDPLEIMVEYAHEYGLRIEAWINPYRIRNSGTKAELATNNPAKKFLNNGSEAVVKYSGGISYNPANKEAQNLIINGVEEIVTNYKIDGIHFDDYFYPTADESFDKSSYANYKSNGGTLSLADWRRENINDLVKGVNSKIKSINPKVIFGISPQGNFENNYNVQFIDTAKWLSNSGYVDYICPQIYYGFENKGYPFADTVKRWNDMIKTDDVILYVGIAPYKIGLEDKWAGSGKNEWKQTNDILQKMVLETRKYKNCGGFFMYRYDSLFNPSSEVKAQVNKEIENVKSIL